MGKAGGEVGRQAGVLSVRRCRDCGCSEGGIVTRRMVGKLKGGLFFCLFSDDWRESWKGPKKAA